MNNVKENRMSSSKLSDFLKKSAFSRLRLLFLLLGGVLTGLTLVLPKIGFIEWMTLVPVGAVMLYRASSRDIRLRSLYFDGFVFFYSFYLTCFHWFTYLYPLDFVDGMTKAGALAVVIVAWFGLSLLQALISACFFILLGGIFRSRLCSRAVILKPFFAGAVWAICEWSQTIGWWGVPWGRLPIGQTEYLAGIQNASWFGSYFITFMLVSVNFLIALALIEITKLCLVRICAVLSIALIAFQYGSGALIYFTHDATAGEKITVACIQGNVSSAEKWDKSSRTKTIENYRRYTEEAASEGAQVVIWPETAIPYDISYAQSYYGDVFGDMAKENGIYLLVGAYVNREGNSYNSLVCFTPNGEMLDSVYSKRHLVPFGEYVPLRPLIETLIPPLAELVLSEDDVMPGEGAQIIETDDGLALGGLICFDSIYEELTLESVRGGAELICLSTNDSWFIDSAALYMHNAQAQIRAVESGRYVARAANTGISTVINSKGEVIDELGALVEGKIVCDVYASDRTTLWSVIGNSFVYLCIAVCVAVIADNAFVKIKSKKELTK